MSPPGYRKKNKNVFPIDCKFGKMLSLKKHSLLCPFTQNRFISSSMLVCTIDWYFKKLFKTVTVKTRACQSQAKRIMPHFHPSPRLTVLTVPDKRKFSLPCLAEILPKSIISLLELLPPWEDSRMSQIRTRPSSDELAKMLSFTGLTERPYTASSWANTSKVSVLEKRHNIIILPSFALAL